MLNINNVFNFDCLIGTWQPAEVCFEKIREILTTMDKTKLENLLKILELPPVPDEEEIRQSILGWIDGWKGSLTTRLQMQQGPARNLNITDASTTFS